MRNRKSLLILMAIILTATCSITQVAQAQATNVTVPFNQNMFIPCADGGTGEVVDFSGTEHSLVRNVTSNGVSHLTLFIQSVASGVGEITGDKYQATLVTQEEGNAGPFNNGELTLVNNLRFIGQGNDNNNFLIQQIGHITVNANGFVTVNFDSTSVDCR